MVSCYYLIICNIYCIELSFVPFPPFPLDRFACRVVICIFFIWNWKRDVTCGRGGGGSFWFFVYRFGVCLNCHVDSLPSNIHAHLVTRMFVCFYCAKVNALWPMGKEQ